MLNKRIINTGGGGAACTTDTTQILNAESTQSLALYRFEDNANDTASGTGKFGKGAVFNGSNSEITLPAALSDGSTTDTNCISFWFNVDAEVTSSSSNNEIMMFSKSGSNDGKIALGSTTGNFSNETFSVTSDTGNQYTYITETIPAGWNHAVVQWNSSTTKWDIYLNGQAKSTSTFGTNEQGKLFLNFGKRSSYYYNGRLDQVRVFNKSLSSSEVTTLYNETSSTVDTLQILGDTSCIATYRFEGNAQDLSGNYYHGSASNIIYDYNGTESNITYVTGKFGKAAVFNGSNSKITLPITTNYSSLSISCWVKFDALPTGNADATLVFKGYYTSGTNTQYLHLRYEDYTDQFKFAIRNNNAYNQQAASGVTATTGVWYHVVGTLDSSGNAQIYVNGNAGTAITSAPTMTNSNNFEIGSYGGNVAVTNGNIDQVRIFDKALSLGEINSLYNETATSAASATIDNPSTLAYYKMADASDETGNYNGTVTDVDFNVEGKYGFAGKFNGTSSRIVVPKIGDITGDVTFSVWANINPLSHTRRLRLIEINANSNGYAGTLTVMYKPSDGEFKIRAGNGTSSNSDVITHNYVLTANLWYHIVVTRNNTTNVSKLYINTTEVDSETVSVNSSYPSNAQTFIGDYIGSSSLNYNWDGKLDQIRIFNKAISASEVNTLYNEIQCANAITAPENYFQTKLYTGNSGTQPITGLAFKPDFVWIKRRDSGIGNTNHLLFDSIRDTGKRLMSNAANAESTETDELTSFDINGFTVGADASTNGSGGSMVSWNWKAGSSNVTNNDGTIQSTVRASQESGFSIVKYTGNGSNGATVGHGLNTSPNLWIIKQRSGTQNWLVGSSSLSASDRYLMLDGTNAELTNAPNIWSVSSSTITFPTSYTGTNNNTSTYIGYFFHNVDGYQRIGSYVGNGSAEGPFVYIGFEPAWLMIKQTNGSNHWVIKDNKRSTSNPREERLKANQSNAENTGADVDFFTNGFQIKSASNEVNDNNDTYLFLAIAANPDTTAPTKANSFNIKLYTGNDSNDRDITGLGFKPDFLWIKRRGSEPHALYDSVRGPNLQLTTHNTDTEATNSGSYLGMSSFDADGFNVGNNGGTNRAPHDYVAWAWKGLDHDRNLPAINNDGSITSLVSANIAAGFSIVSYRGNATSGATVGHGLGGELDFLIVKSTNLTQAWNVYVKGVTDTNAKYLRLNETNSIYTTVNPRFIPGNFNDNVFSVGSDNACNGNNDDYIAYCFRSISGYSKVGTYTMSTNNAVTVDVGFAPKFVLLKEVNRDAGWVTVDSQRQLSGNYVARLYPHSSTGESSGQQIQISGNTFIINWGSTGNFDNGGTGIYLAIS